MSEPRDLIDRAVRQLRQPVEMDPAARRRLVATLREAPAPRIGPVRRAWRWLARPRPVMVSPLTAVAAAAAIAIVALARPVGDGANPEQVENPIASATNAEGVAANGSELAGTADSSGIRFSLVAPGASRVALVGDFNDWNPGEHLLRPSVTEYGVWEIWVPLEPGRHVYSFFIDGRQWIPDPVAARAVGGSVSAPSSVILVGERSS